MMEKCKFKDQIDDYLLNRMEGEEKDKFEAHYFNCPFCFKKITERNDLIEVIKSKGPQVFGKDYVFEEKKAPFPDRFMPHLAPRQWAWVAVSAVLLLAVIFGGLPLLRNPAPRFVLPEGDIVRGDTLSLISPVIDVNSIPEYFEWKKLGDDVEYKIYVYNDELLWTESTRETKLAVPDEVKKQMTAGQKYSWQVKVFSSQGTLIAVSSRVQFKIIPKE